MYRSPRVRKNLVSSDYALKAKAIKKYKRSIGQRAAFLEENQRIVATVVQTPPRKEKTEAELRYDVIELERKAKKGEQANKQLRADVYALKKEYVALLRAKQEKEKWQGQDFTIS